MSQKPSQSAQGVHVAQNDGQENWGRTLERALGTVTGHSSVTQLWLVFRLHDQIMLQYLNQNNPVRVVLTKMITEGTHLVLNPTLYMGGVVISKKWFLLSFFLALSLFFALYCLQIYIYVIHVNTHPEAGTRCLPITHVIPLHMSSHYTCDTNCLNLLHVYLPHWDSSAGCQTARTHLLWGGYG